MSGNQVPGPVRVVASSDALTSGEMGPVSARGLSPEAAEKLAEASTAIATAIDALEKAKDGVPAYSVHALAFLKAEVMVAQRRLQNARKALGCSR